MPCEALAAWLAADPQRSRGEFALVLHPWAQAKPKDDGEVLLALLLKEQLPVKVAARIAAEASGGSRNALYEAALRLRSEAAD